MGRQRLTDTWRLRRLAGHHRGGNENPESDVSRSRFPVMSEGTEHTSGMSQLEIGSILEDERAALCCVVL